MDRDKFVASLLSELSLRQDLQGETRPRDPSELLRDLCCYDFVRPSPEEASQLAEAVAEACACRMDCEEKVSEIQRAADDALRKPLELMLTNKMFENLDFMAQQPRQSNGQQAPSHEGSDASAAAYAELSAVSWLSLVRYMLQSPVPKLSQMLKAYQPSQPSRTQLEDSETQTPVEGDLSGLPLDYVEMEASSPDGDDFVYESGVEHAAASSTHDLQMPVLPVLQAPGGHTSSILRCCLAEIINMLSLSKISALSHSRWKELGLAGEAWEIIQMLQKGGKVGVPLLEDCSTEDDSSMDQLRRSWPILAFVLRDRVAQYPMEAEDCLTPLIALLQRQVVAEPPLQHVKIQLSEDAMVGLQTLSWLCSHFEPASISQGVSGSPAAALKRWLRPSLPALGACLDALLAEGSDMQPKHLDDLVIASTTILRFYTGVCADGTLPVSLGDGLYEAGAHRLLLQIMLAFSSQPAERLLLCFTAQSGAVASYLSRAPAALKYLGSESFTQKQPGVALAWAVLISAASASAGADAPLAPSDLRDGLLSCASAAVKSTDSSPADLLEGLRALECSRLRLIPWIRTSQEWAAAMEAFQMSLEKCAFVVQPASLLEPAACDGEGDKASRRKALRESEIAQARRSLKALLHLDISKGD